MSKKKGAFSFLSAGEELAALRHQRLPQTDVQEMDMALLLGSPKKNEEFDRKKARDRKDNSKKGKKAKKPRRVVEDSDSEDEDEEDGSSSSVINITDEFQQDPEEVLANILMERTRQTQRNLTWHYRMKAMEADAPKPLDEELANYLSAHNTSVPGGANEEITIEDECDDLDVPIVVMVRWQFSRTTQRHMVKQYQTFESIFKHYADKESVSIDKICMEAINAEGGPKIIQPWFTPDALKFNGPAMIEGCLISNGTQHDPANNSLEEDEEDEIDDGKMELKMQLKGQRNRLTVRIGPQEAFKLAMLKLAEQIQQPLEKLRFHFDGEIVMNTQTPEELDLDGGEVFDVEILE